MNKPPNVLLIMVDQMRYDCAGYAGHPVARTPTLDRLAGAGVVFENAYCASPVCSPARASWLTGLYPHAHLQLTNYSPHRPAMWGGRMRPECVTLGDAFAGAGYSCGIVGPWHLGDDETPQHGFKAMWSTYRYHKIKDTDAYQGYLKERGLLEAFKRDSSSTITWDRCMRSGQLPVTTSALPTEHQRTTWTVDRSIEFLHSVSAPFFLFTSIKDPHPPLAPPSELLNLYPPESMPVYETWQDTMAGKPAFLREDIHRCAQRFGYAGIQTIVAHYLALLTHVDNQLARLLAALDAAGLARDTVVAFISDHGEMLGEHGLFTKGVMYEGSARVPCLLRWPGHLPPGMRVRNAFAGVDLAPTLLALAGIAPPPMHGHSVADAILTGREPAAHDVLAEIPSRAGLKASDVSETALAATIMIRRGRWKYIWHRTDADELYDLEADPLEMQNLSSRLADTSAELRSRVRALLTQQGPGPYAWCLERDVTPSAL